MGDPGFQSLEDCLHDQASPVTWMDCGCVLTCERCHWANDIEALARAVGVLHD